MKLRYKHFKIPIEFKEYKQFQKISLQLFRIRS